MENCYTEVGLRLHRQGIKSSQVIDKKWLWHYRNKHYFVPKDFLGAGCIHEYACERSFLL